MISGGGGLRDIEMFVIMAKLMLSKHIHISEFHNLFFKYLPVKCTTDIFYDK